MIYENEEVMVYPHIVYYNVDHSKSKICTDNISSVLKVEYTLTSTWQSLIAELEHGTKFLVFHADMMDSTTNFTAIELVEAVNTVVKFMPNSVDLRIAVIVEPSTPLSVVRTLQKTGIQGILLDLNFYSVEEAAVGMNAFVNKIPYWPKHVIERLPGNAKKLPNSDNITLTPRQEQVFKFITERGSSNKTIAKALGVSESTVKLHVTEVFKKYGVRSRTQLAVFSNIS